MQDDPQDRRLYSEQDVSRLLRRATEIQEASGVPEHHGLTFEELQQVAREVGIDPAALAAAAAELETREQEGFRLLGGAASISLERVVAGDVDEAGWEAMLEEVRRTLHPVGVTSRTGRTMEWTHNGRREQAQVVVTARDGRVRLRVSQHYPRTAAMVFLPPLSAMLAILPAILETFGFGWMGWGIGLVLLMTVLAASRAAFGSLARRRTRKAQALMRRLEQVVAETSAPTPAAVGRSDAERPAPRLDAISPEPAADAPAPAARRARV